MKKNYSSPVMEVVEYDVKNIVTTGNVSDIFTQGTGEGQKGTVTTVSYDTIFQGV